MNAEQELIESLKIWGFIKTTNTELDTVYGGWKYNGEYPPLEMSFVKGIDRPFCLMNLHVWSEATESIITHADDYEFSSVFELEFLFKRISRANAVFLALEEKNRLREGSPIFKWTPLKVVGYGRPYRFEKAFTAEVVEADDLIEGIMLSSSARESIRGLRFKKKQKGFWYFFNKAIKEDYFSEENYPRKSAKFFRIVSALAKHPQLLFYIIILIWVGVFIYFR